MLVRYQKTLQAVFRSYLFPNFQLFCCCGLFPLYHRRAEILEDCRGQPPIPHAIHSLCAVAGYLPFGGKLQHGLDLLQLPFSSWILETFSLPRQGSWDLSVIASRWRRSLSFGFLIHLLLRYFGASRVPYIHRSLFADLCSAVLSVFNRNIAMDIDFGAPAALFTDTDLPSLAAPPPAML